MDPMEVDSRRILQVNKEISACRQQKNWQRALVLLKAAEAARLQPDVITFTGVISACEKSSQWISALRLWQNVQRSLLPDAILCGATVSACASAGQWQHAFQLLLEVEAR